LNLILASASPRRSAILTQLGIPFRVEPSRVTEEGRGRPPLDWPRLFAEEKAVDVSRRNNDALVLGFDTLVFLDAAPLGKPKDKADALRMLSLLNGRVHQVISGVALAQYGKI
jgi:septum formation protein